MRCVIVYAGYDRNVLHSVAMTRMSCIIWLWQACVVLSGYDMNACYRLAMIGMCNCVGSLSQNCVII